MNHVGLARKLGTNAGLRQSPGRVVIIAKTSEDYDQILKRVKELGGTETDEVNLYWVQGLLIFFDDDLEISIYEETPA